MKKNLIALLMACFALFSLVSCTKDHVDLVEKDTIDVDFAAQVADDAAAVSSSWQLVKSFIVPLNGANEVPAANTPTVGEARIFLYKSLNRRWMNFNIKIKKLPAGRIITNAHIHRGVSTVAGPVAQGLFGHGLGMLVTFGIKGSTINLSEALFNEINDGLQPLYVNVHSNVFPGGEIRGQMVP